MAPHAATAGPEVPTAIASQPLLDEVPTTIDAAIAFAPPAAASNAWRHFVEACAQPTLAEHALRQRERLRRLFAVDPMSADDFARIGLHAPSGATVLWPSGGRLPLLLVRVQDETKLNAFLRAYAGDDAKAPPRPPTSIGRATLYESGPAGGQALDAIPTWAREGTLLWLEPGGGATALRQALQARAIGQRLSARPDWPRQFGQGLGEAALASVFVRLALPGACAALDAQLIAITATAGGIDLQGRLLGAPAPQCLPAPPSTGEPARPSPDGERPWLQVSGASLTQAVALLRPGLARLSAGRSVAPPSPTDAVGAGRDVAERAVRVFDAWTRRSTYRGTPLEGSFSASVGGPLDAPVASLRLSCRDPHVLAQWMRAACAPQRVRCKHEGEGAKAYVTLHDSAHPNWFLAQTGPWLLAAPSEPAVRAQVQPLLCWPAVQRPVGPVSPGPDTPPSAPLLRASLHTPGLARALTHALMNQRPRGVLGDWLPMPQLMLAGPIGDILRDFDALGSIEASLWRERDGVRWHVQQRRLLLPQ